MPLTETHLRSLEQKGAFIIKAAEHLRRLRVLVFSVPSSQVTLSSCGWALSVHLSFTLTSSWSFPGSRPTAAPAPTPLPAPWHPVSLLRAAFLCSDARLPVCLDSPLALSKIGLFHSQSENIMTSSSCVTCSISRQCTFLAGLMSLAHSGPVSCLGGDGRGAKEQTWGALCESVDCGREGTQG